jgi:hypothetical protein
VELVGVNIAHTFYVVNCLRLTVAITPQKRGGWEERELSKFLHFLSSRFQPSARFFRETADHPRPCRRPAPCWGCRRGR